MYAEYVHEYRPQATAHMTMAGVRHEGVVPQVGRLESAPNDLADVDDPGELTVWRAYPVSDVRISSQPREIALERLHGPRWCYPATVKSAASRHSGQKFCAALSRWRFEN